MTIAPINNSPPVPINALPEELTIQIFTDFTPVELAGKIMLVSRTWNRLASDSFIWRSKLPELNCNIIDEAVWLQHASEIAEEISFEGLHPLDHRLAYIEVAKLYARLTAAETSIKDGQGVTILTIPKGLSINLVDTVFGNRIRHILGAILNELGDAKVDQAYRVIVTKNVLTGSRNKSVDDQSVLARKAGCSMPKALEAMVLALLTEKSASIRLFVDNPWNSTRCVDVIGEWGWSLVVGGFALTGLSVYSYDFARADCGTVGLRKF